ncbi:hypothetical protein OAJ75_01980 [Candidatus Pelagibacter sp.]|nr:hypothetical protein [Candidatus Pelagibacter sp.]
MNNFNKNNSYIDREEAEIGKKFSKEGYYIFEVKDKKELDKINITTSQLISKFLKINFNKLNLDSLHSFCDNKDINKLRLNVFKELNKKEWIRPTYYRIFKKYLDILVGNELSMQNQLNLSIQMPKDKNSTLPMHADSFNGESPYEVVAWLPLVNCFGSKSMYFISPKVSNKLVMKMNKFAKKNMGGLPKMTKNFNFEKYFIKVNYGQGLIFSPNYFHGNKLNKTKETRISLNTRFKSLLSPYTTSEKTLGSFYEPIIIKTLTKTGLNVKKPGNF